MNCLVTGASRGLGFEIAKLFKSKGHQVCLISRHEERLEKAFADLNANNKDLKIAVDLSKKDAVDRIINTLEKEHWYPSIIVNNAAQYLEDNFLTARIEMLPDLLQLNAVSGFDLIRRLMTTKQVGLQYIINIGSVLSRDFRREAVSYTVSKHLQDAFSQFIAQEARTRGIKSTLILPGSMNTTSWDGIDAPKERFVQPQDVVSLIDALLSLSDNCWVEEIVLKPLDASL